MIVSLYLCSLFKRSYIKSFLSVDAVKLVDVLLLLSFDFAELSKSFSLQYLLDSFCLCVCVYLYFVEQKIHMMSQLLKHIQLEFGICFCFCL